MINARGSSDRVLSVILIVTVLLSLTACSKTSSGSTTFEQSNQIIRETVMEESFITESQFKEFITSEIYLEEIIIAEETISELLLEDELINEVVLCQTIYVPQDNIEEFSVHSQTAHLFGENIDLSALLTKVSVGTGVIVTVVILRVAGLPQPVAQVVAAAADASLKFAATGAAVGSLFGGLTGAANEIDATGRTAAIIGFATATAGLIIASISFVAAIPTAGTSAPIAAVGIKLVIAGVSLLTATAGTAYAGYQAVKTFKSTDSADIDWTNIDWKSVGVSAAEKAVENAADGYMWGAIIGTVYGGAEAYYQMYATPYTKYADRLMQTPKEGNGGKWSGKRGESDFILDDPIKLPNGTEISRVTYKNAIPDFSPYQEVQVNIPSMTNTRYGKGGNFEQADSVLAEIWTRSKYNGQTWTARQVGEYRVSNSLTWHEMSNMKTMQLVPSEVNRQFTHFGGVAEYNAMIGQQGVASFD